MKNYMPNGTHCCEREWLISPCSIYRLPSGDIIRDRFNYMEYIGIGRYNWWDYTIDSKANARKSYIEELKAIATYQGVSPEEIDALLNSGFTLDEKEDYICCME